MQQILDRGVEAQARLLSLLTKADLLAFRACSVTARKAVQDASVESLEFAFHCEEGEQRVEVDDVRRRLSVWRAVFPSSAAAVKVFGWRYEIRDEEFGRFARSKRVWLFATAHVTDYGIGRLTEVTDLRLTNLPLARGDTLARLKHLRHLSLRWCFKSGFACLSQLGDQLESLRITDAVDVDLALYAMRRLRTLDLDHCTARAEPPSPWPSGQATMESGAARALHPAIDGRADEVPARYSAHVCSVICLQMKSCDGDNLSIVAACSFATSITIKDCTGIPDSK